jgi:hypothetical protein
MSKPVWVTKSSFLGTIPEQQFYSTLLEAYDDTNPTNPVYFEVVAGQPPNGIHLDGFGGLVGSPQTLRKIAGVPANVPQAVTSQFAIRTRTSRYVTTFTGDGSSTSFTLPTNPNFEIFRTLILVDNEFVSGYVKKVGSVTRMFLRKPPAMGANIQLSLYDSTSPVSDRTFTLTVVGENAPEILNVITSTGSYLDGTYYEYATEALDLDTTDVLTYYISSGELPAGITLNAETGLVSGYLEILPPDLLNGNTYVDYNFTVTVSDTKLTDSKSFSLRVYSLAALDAANTGTTSDNTFFTADLTKKHTPVIRNSEGEIGPTRHDNFFMYKFNGTDFDGDVISYSKDIGSGALFDDILYGFDGSAFDKAPFQFPPGLSLDTETGWLYGYIPFQSELKVKYEFTVSAYKRDVFFLDYDGSTLYNYISLPKKFSITVLGTENADVTWVTDSDLGTIENGSVSELKVEAIANNGHDLFYELATGEYSRLPAGLKLLSNGLIVGRPGFSTFSLDGDYDIPTTFDKTSFFFDETTFDQTRRFTVRVYDDEGTVNVTKEFTIRIDRTYDKPYENLYIGALLNQTDKNNFDTIISDEDLIPTADLYRGADKYWGKTNMLKMLIANGVNAAVPADFMAAMANNHYIKSLYFGDIKTAQVLDENDDIKYEVVYVEIKDDTKNSVGKNVNSTITAKTQSGDLTLYPNNLTDMRKRIFNQIGQVNKRLPDWMIAKQADGSVLGFTNACILAYVKPGKSAAIAYRIANRAKLDPSNSDYFDFKNVTFITDRYIWDTDLLANYNKETKKYLTAPATTFDVFSKRYAYVVSEDGSTLIYPFESVYVNDPNSLPNPKATTFDKNSLQFLKYQDVYADPEERDKYLMFPKRTILN